MPFAAHYSIQTTVIRPIVFRFERNTVSRMKICLEDISLFATPSGAVCSLSVYMSVLPLYRCQFYFFLKTALLYLYLIYRVFAAAPCKPVKVSRWRQETCLIAHLINWFHQSSLQLLAIFGINKPHRRALLYSNTKVPVSLRKIIGTRSTEINVSVYHSFLFFCNFYSTNN